MAAHVCSEGTEHMLQRSGFGLPRVAAVLLLPGVLLPIHVSSAFCWYCGCSGYLINIKKSINFFAVSKI